MKSSNSRRSLRLRRRISSGSFIKAALFASATFRGCSFHRIRPRKVEPTDYEIIGFGCALNGIEAAVELSAKGGR
jgi:hypothetical protein